VKNLAKEIGREGASTPTENSGSSRLRGQQAERVSGGYVRRKVNCVSAFEKKDGKKLVVR